MKYSRFEALVLAVGFAAVAGSMFFGYGGTFIAEEVIAQVLLLGVLFGAVHWGRTGGFITALVASGAYILLRIPLVLGGQGLTMDVASLVLVRVVTYGLIGIVGGELASRIKYIFARLESNSGIDEWTQIYNQRLIVRSLRTSCGQYARYDTPCSAIIIELSPRLTQDLRASKQRSIIRGVANYLRGDIRIVDEAGRLDDGRFMIVLPHTARDGCQVVAERLYKGVCDTLGAKEDSVTVTTLSAPDDAEALNALAATLADELREKDASSVAAAQASRS